MSYRKSVIRGRVLEQRANPNPPKIHLKGWIKWSGKVQRKKTLHKVKTGDTQSSNIDEIDCAFCRKLTIIARMEGEI